MLWADDFGDESTVSLIILAAFDFRNELFQLRDCRELQLRRLGQVALALGFRHVGIGPVELFFRGGSALQLVLLGGPCRRQLIRLCLQIRNLALDCLEAIHRSSILFFLQSLGLDPQLQEAAIDLVEFFGLGIDLHAQTRRGFVHKVDGLVRQEPVSDIPVRQIGGRNNRGVRHADTMVRLVATLQATENRDCIGNGWLIHENGHEPSCEGGVTFNMFAILVQSRRTDTVQFATRQGRLEEV